MNWKSIIGTIAPTIATALGGPMAGAAVKFLGSQFLGDENAGEEKVAEFVRNASPDQLLQMKQGDQEFAIQMEKLGVDVFKIEADDKKNARKEHKDSVMPAVLSIILTIGLIAFTAALMHYKVPDENKEIVYMIFGSYLTAWVSCIGYWFGTTKGSSDKNKMIK